jgi:putative transcriptional regulator
MTTRNEGGTEAKGRTRMRSEIVEAMQGLNKIGVIGDDDLRKTTMRMLGRDAVPKVGPLSPSEIVRVRERVNVSQAVLAGYFNVATSTVSQWERGERRPTGAALKLLHVVSHMGIEPLR